MIQDNISVFAQLISFVQDIYLYISQHYFEILVVYFIIFSFIYIFEWLADSDYFIVRAFANGFIKIYIFSFIVLFLLPFPVLLIFFYFKETIILIIGMVVALGLIVLIIKLMEKGKNSENELFHSISPEQQKANEERRKIEALKNEQGIIERRKKLIPEKYISTFLLHAEKRFNKMDKYGNRDKEALMKEIVDYMRMITNEINTDSFSRKCVLNAIDAFASGNSYPKLNEDYGWLQGYLKKIFSEHMEQKEKKKRDSGVDIDTMSGIEFERYLAEIFESKDYFVRFTSETGDQGADLIAEKGNKRLIIQAKRHRATVGNGAVQEVIGAIGYYEGTEGWVITNSIFTSSAIELARKNNIRLIDGTELSKLLSLI